MKKPRIQQGLPFALVTGALVLCGLSGCTETECATPDYRRAECRVVAEHNVSRFRSPDGIELRFQDPSATIADQRWAPQGVIRAQDDKIKARVAHMGAFALSLHNHRTVPTTLSLELSNVHPQAALTLDGTPVSAQPVGNHRSLSLSIEAGATRWLRGSLELACPKRRRIVVLSDIQTNPIQFGKIIERIQVEAQNAQAAGELLLGAILPGDLTESSTEAEFRVFRELLNKSSVPFALTAGNHDVYSANFPFYNENFGPGNYAFSTCGVHVAMLDSGDGTLAPSVIGRLPELFARGANHWSLMAVHHPPHPGRLAAGWSDEKMAAITLSEFALQGGDLVLAGHAHALREFDLKMPHRTMREIISGTAGAWQGAGQPRYGFVRLTFEEGKSEIETCFVEVPVAGGPESSSTEIPACQTP